MTATIAPPPYPQPPQARAVAPPGGYRRRHRVLHLLRRLAWWTVIVGLVVASAGFGQAWGIPAVPAALLATALGVLGRLVSLRRNRSRHRLVGLCIASVALLGLSATTWSYSTYLSAPGAASVAVRTSDWMRDHGMSPIVDRLEQRIYGGPGPSNGRVAADQLPTAGPTRSATPTPPVAAQKVTPARVRGLLDRSLAGEGLWKPGTRVVDGHAVAYTTFLRPDPAHTDVVAAAVWLDPTATRLTYVPGTKQGAGWAWSSGIPTDQRASLVAAFNGGFKFKDTPGGYMTEGRTPDPLVDGQASLVIHTDGTADIGAWGSQVRMTPDVASVRQNLRLIVDGSNPAPGLHTSIANDWGKRRWQLQYTNRSGIGITADHALVYVSGSNLTTETLASALVRVDAVRAMELDIHASNPTFNFFAPTPATRGDVTGTRLVPSMRSPADRFLAPDQRDFFAVTVTGAGSK